MESERVTLAARLLDEHVDVRETVVVIDTPEHSGGAPELLAIVVPEDFCSGADLRDELITSVGLEPSPPVVVLVPDQDGVADRADRRALVELAAASPYAYRWREPATAVERLLCAVISESLGRDRASLTDNFVDLGGDSVTAIAVVTEFETRSGIELPLESMFESESIADLVELAAGGAGD